MNEAFPSWLEAAILTACLGAIGASTARARLRAFAWGMTFTSAAAGCALLACVQYYWFSGTDPGVVDDWQSRFLGDRLLALDDLSAAMVPAVALLHWVTAFATPRARMRRFSYTWSLAALALRLALFSCRDVRLLVALLTVEAALPGFELRAQRRAPRVYAVHLGVFAILLIVGACGLGSSSTSSHWGVPVVAAAVLIRCGAIPFHCWVTDWIENASSGIGLLFVAPLSGIYALARLVVPSASDNLLRAIVALGVLTAIYAGALAVVQREARRLLAYLVISGGALVLVGFGLHTRLSITGALCLWFSTLLSIGGFGLAIRALEARFGPLALVAHRGLYDHAPTLAVCFLLTGLAGVGFPGTLGFIATELVVESALHAGPVVGLGVVAATALGGVAVVRAYLLLFTGARHASPIALGIGPRERAALLIVAALILGGGLFPHAGVAGRQRAATAILDARAALHPLPARDARR